MQYDLERDIWRDRRKIANNEPSIGEKITPIFNTKIMPKIKIEEENFQNSANL